MIRKKANVMDKKRTWFGLEMDLIKNIKRISKRKGKPHTYDSQHPKRNKDSIYIKIIHGCNARSEYYLYIVTSCDEQTQKYFECQNL